MSLSLNTLCSLLKANIRPEPHHIDAKSCDRVTTKVIGILDVNGGNDVVVITHTANACTTTCGFESQKYEFTTHEIEKFTFDMMPFVPNNKSTERTFYIFS